MTGTLAVPRHVASLRSFPEVRDYIQDYLSLLERKPFLDKDKTELYVLFSSCLEVSVAAPRAGPPLPKTSIGDTSKSVPSPGRWAQRLELRHPGSWLDSGQGHVQEAASRCLPLPGPLLPSPHPLEADGKHALE